MPALSRTIKMPQIKPTLLTIWAISYWSERSSPLFARNRLNRNRLVRDENQNTATNNAISKKIWNRLRFRPGIGAFHDSGTPAALTALIVKNTIAARLKIVVRIAMRLVSILNRLKKRRTASLWRARAVSRPTENQTTNAMIPRNETSCPKTCSNGFCKSPKSIVVSLGALRAGATKDKKTNPKLQIPGKLQSPSYNGGNV